MALSMQTALAVDLLEEEGVGGAGWLMTVGKGIQGGYLAVLTNVVISTLISSHKIYFYLMYCYQIWIVVVGLTQFISHFITQIVRVFSVPSIRWPAGSEKPAQNFYWLYCVNIFLLLILSYGSYRLLVWLCVLMSYIRACLYKS